MMQTGFADRHGKSSSISGSKDFSLVDMVHESLVSFIGWPRWSVEDFGSSWNSGSLITSREVERFLTAVKICSSKEEEILVAARI